jgi:hypothetical protein
VNGPINTSTTLPTGMLNYLFIYLLAQQLKCQLKNNNNNSNNNNNNNGTPSNNVAQGEASTNV